MCFFAQQHKAERRNKHQTVKVSLTVTPWYADGKQIRASLNEGIVAGSTAVVSASSNFSHPTTHSNTSIQRLLVSWQYGLAIHTVERLVVLCAKPVVEKQVKRISCWYQGYSYHEPKYSLTKHDLYLKRKQSAFVKTNIRLYKGHFPSYFFS